MPLAAEPALALYAKGEYAQALELIERLLGDDSASASLLNVAAACACMLHQGARAERYWLRAIDADADHIDSYNNLGAAWQQGGRLDEARGLYLKAIARRPDNAQSHYNLGTLQQQTGQRSEAQASYRRALTLEPGHARANNNLAALLLDEERWDEVRRCLHAPGDAAAYSNLGHALLKLGDATQAQACCEKAIALMPELAAAHDNLGLALQAQGRHAQAEQCHLHALRLAGESAAILFNLGCLYQLTQHHAHAESHWRRAVAADPGHCDAWLRLAALLRGLARADEARAAAAQAVALRPRQASCHLEYGLAWQKAGNDMRALAAFEYALELDPVNLDVLPHLANALAGAGRADEAEQAYVRALERKPDSVQLHNNFGALLLRRRLFARAEEHYRKAIALDPKFVTARYNLAVVCLQSSRTGEAESILREALALAPDHADGWYALGDVCQRKGEPEQAEQAYRRALALRPGHAPVINNLATLQQQAGRLDAAEELYRQALAAAPDYPEPQWNLGFLLQAQGRMEEGWPLMEARHHPALPRPITRKPALPFPQWQGEPLGGKSIMVWPEQGFGDEIQFVRYLPMLKAAGAAHVTLVCKDALLPLFKDVAGADTVLGETRAASLAPHDYWVLLLSLPLRFGTTLASIPAPLPYLHACPERAAQWAALLPQAPLRIGLVWKGYGGHINDAHRSLPDCRLLAPLWEVPGTAFVSLQRGMDEDAAQSRDGWPPMTDLGAQIGDFADTAAVVSQLDLVICVDTAVAHVAGALGKPCWIMLPAVHPDWRWLRGRSDSPWYPGAVRLYRQERAGDWSGVVAAMADDLHALRDAGGACQTDYCAGIIPPA